MPGHIFITWTYKLWACVKSFTSPPIGTIRCKEGFNHVKKEHKISQKKSGEISSPLLCIKPSHELYIQYVVNDEIFLHAAGQNILHKSALCLYHRQSYPLLRLHLLRQ